MPVFCASRSDGTRCAVQRKVVIAFSFGRAAEPCPDVIRQIECLIEPNLTVFAEERLLQVGDLSSC
jgi:hypothetical protein